MCKSKIIKCIYITLVTVFLIPNMAHSTYNANISGKVTDVLIYTHATYILFRLDNQPSTHPTCNPDYFTIDSALSADIRHQLLSRLLTAYAKGEVINIGYDKDGECANTRIRVHRVG